MSDKAELLRKLSRKCDELALDLMGDNYTDEMRTLASFRLQEAMVGVFTILGDLPTRCESCGHLTRQHFDPYGCQHERGDGYVGDTLQAPGTCGCKAWTVQGESDATQSESTITH